MGCFSKSSIKTRTAPVIQQPLHKQNNFPTQTATGTLNTRTNYGADAQVLRSIQTSTPTVFYSSEKLYLSPDQYRLLNKSVMVKMDLLKQCESIFINIKTGNKLCKLGVSTKSEADENINNKIDFVIDKIAMKCKKAANEMSNIEINKEFPLFKQSYDVMGKTCDLLSSREKLTALVNNPVSIKFFHVENLDHMYTPAFYKDCLSIAAGGFDKENNTAEERKALLEYMAKNYCLKGVTENQLPTLKKELEKIKKNSSLDKNFIDVLESSIKTLEVGLKNMNNPKRSAIIEKFASPERFTVYRPADMSKLNLYESSFLEKASDEELIAVINQLKAIPVDLA